MNVAHAVPNARPRGRLHVYAGTCEGAGATSRMLDEVARLRASGTDVVLGVLASAQSPAADPALELHLVPIRG